MEKNDILALLDHINPALCSYQEWTDVGMALQYEGLTAADWDRWSQRDPARYHSGECFKKWGSFAVTNASNPQTGGRIFYLAQQHGWSPSKEPGEALEWDGVIHADAIIDPSWVEAVEVRQPDDWDPVNEITRYLSTLFEASENVGYVASAYLNSDPVKGDKWIPSSKGAYDRTAGELIQQLGQCQDISEVFGDFNPDAGAWIRFNPMDGKGAKNENVTDYRYALVESDSISLEMQNALLRELELPIACLVHSGSKSLHAIVRVDAADRTEYKKRVEYLYNVCRKNGLELDTQNSNPSRLSRMPGVLRGGQKQYLVDVNLGKKDWAEWYEWAESVNDDLPDPESLTDVWDDLPELAPGLIDGVLRQGHKMLIAGPSKAGKSFLLIEMCLAIAEGRKWLGWQCTRGRVLYVNLELDRASCLHRFKDVYKALNWRPDHVDNVDIWNLRGKAAPMDKLAPKLIRRAAKKGYIAVVIDPIYKVITGDENSAHQMAEFANNFDKICTELGVAVIYCHHHSKGYQGGKRSMDRASGSGVFARDPDALLDLTELELTHAAEKQLESKAKCAAIAEQIRIYGGDYFDGSIGPDDLMSVTQMELHMERALTSAQRKLAAPFIADAVDAAKRKSAWRIEGTLREYPRFDPVNVWFDYPTHLPDEIGILADLDPETEKAPWQKAIDKRKDPEKKKETRQNEIEITFSNLEMEGREQITTADLAEEMGVTSRTVFRRIKEHGGFETEKQGDGNPAIVRRKSSTPQEDSGETKT